MNSEHLGISCEKDLSEIYHAVTRCEELPSQTSVCLAKVLLSKQKCSHTQENPDEENLESHQKRILLGLSIVQHILQHFHANVSYTALLRSLGEKELFETLTKLVKAEDKFVAHQASECLSSYIRKNVLQINVAWFEEFIMSITANSNSINPVHSIDVLKNLLSKARGGQDEHSTIRQTYGECSIQEVCFQALSNNWDSLLATFLNEKLIPPVPALNSFLSLWQKLIKFSWKCNEVERTFHDKTMLLIETWAVHHDLVGFRAPLFYIKILDIVSAGLPYASHIAIQKNIETRTFVKLADKVLELAENLICNLPRRCGLVGFGGAVMQQCNSCYKMQYVSGNDQTSEGCQQSTTDERALEKLVLLLLKACATSGTLSNECTKGIWTRNLRVLSSLKQLVLKVKCASKTDHWLFCALADQDDSLMEAMLCILQLHTEARKDRVAQTEERDNPHFVFLHFLQSVSYDHKVFLDFLTSPETCFLLFLTRYLRFCLNSWEDLCHCCRQFESLSFSQKETDLTTLHDTSSACDIVCQNITSKSNLSAVQSDQTVFVVYGGVSIQVNSGVEEKKDGKISSCHMDHNDYFHETSIRRPSKINLTEYSDSEESEDLPNSTDNSEDSTCDLESEILDKLVSDKEGIQSSLVNKTLDDLMAVFIRVRMAIERLVEKQLFPYNASLILHLLERCEEQYETGP